jgi:hypothetical protein
VRFPEKKYRNFVLGGEDQGREDGGDAAHADRLFLHTKIRINFAPFGVSAYYLPRHFYSAQLNLRVTLSTIHPKPKVLKSFHTQDMMYIHRILELLKKVACNHRLMTIAKIVRF